MRKECDLTRLEGRKSPHPKRLKEQITTRIGVDVLEHFQALAEETGIPYQNLIDLYLRDCVTAGRKPSPVWA